MLTFSDTEKKLSENDLRLVEQDLGFRLPAAVMAHYLIHNGGTPSRSLWVDPRNKWDDIEIRDFMPFLYCRDFGDDPAYTANGIALEQWQLNELPRHLLPFAMDWGGNYICIDLKDGDIYFFVKDVWSDNLSIEENLKANANWITNSFSSFIAELIEAEED